MSHIKKSYKISCQIITIGDEILYGHILDTNSKWLSEKLTELGIHVSEQKTIGDNYEIIYKTISLSINEYDLVVLTGGLGPTNDDITKNCLNDIYEGKLIYDIKTLNHIKSYFKKRKLKFTKKNKDQALIPDTCKVLHNKYGTAPGMVFEKNNNFLISLPGVPFEMKSIFEEGCVVFLKEKFNLPVIVHRVIKTVGIGESWLSDMIKEWEEKLDKNLSLAYLPSIGTVKLRLTGVGKDYKKIKSNILKQEKKLYPLINKYIYGYDSDELEVVIGKLLQNQKKNISIAESCTGGHISSLITSVAGCSSYFKGSIVAYNNKIKIENLGVSKEKIEKFGAVSKEVVEEMASNIRKIFNTDIGLATSGIAGPDGGSKEKPIGTVWIAFSDKKNIISKKLNLTERRDINIILSSINILNLLRQKLTQNI